MSSWEGIRVELIIGLVLCAIALLFALVFLIGNLYFICVIQKRQKSEAAAAAAAAQGNLKAEPALLPAAVTDTATVLINESTPLRQDASVN